MAEFCPISTAELTGLLDFRGPLHSGKGEKRDDGERGKEKGIEGAELGRVGPLQC